MGGEWQGQGPGCKGRAEGKQQLYLACGPLASFQQFNADSVRPPLPVLPACSALS